MTTTKRNQITDPTLELRYGKREAARRLRAQADTERNAALFNLSVGEFTTGQEVRDGRIVRRERIECEECGHPLKDDDETHYPDCPEIFVGM